MNIHWLHLAGIDGAVLAVFMFVAGRLQPAATTPSAPGAGAGLELVPWTHLRIATILAVLGAVAMYLLFWTLSR